MQPKPITPTLQPGQLLARGVARHLASLGFASLEEFSPERGKRLDVMGLGPKGELWVIECKSCRADFQSDHKWQGYLEWGDRFFWAVDAAFPLDLLPKQTGEPTGVILADRHDAQVIRMAPETKLPAARRAVIIRKFARISAARLHRLRDPGFSLS